jgi:hypothetical protein
MQYLLSAIAIGILLWVLIGSYIYSKKHAIGRSPWLLVLKSFGVYVAANLVLSLLIQMISWLLYIPSSLWAVVMLVVEVGAVWYYWQWEYKRIGSRPSPDQSGWTSAGSSDDEWN